MNPSTKLSALVKVSQASDANATSEELMHILELALLQVLSSENPHKESSLELKHTFPAGIGMFECNYELN